MSNDGDSNVTALADIMKEERLPPRTERPPAPRRDPPPPPKPSIAPTWQAIGNDQHAIFKLLSVLEDDLEKLRSFELKPVVEMTDGSRVHMGAMPREALIEMKLQELAGAMRQVAMHRDTVDQKLSAMGARDIGPEVAIRKALPKQLLNKLEAELIQVTDATKVAPRKRKRWWR